MKVLLLLLLCILWVWLLLPSQPKERRGFLTLPKQSEPISEPADDLSSAIEAQLSKPLPKIIDNPKIIVSKSQRELSLFSGKQLLRRYPIALGFNPKEDKQKEGDGATPEGEFYIFTKNPKSSYYLSLGISYPNQEDAQRGLKAGLISQQEYQQIISAYQRKTTPPQNTALGGLIYIHGHGSRWDWTRGCVALDDTNMKELFDVIEVGTPVVITK